MGHCLSSMHIACTPIRPTKIVDVGCVNILYGYRKLCDEIGCDIWHEIGPDIGHDVRY